MFLEGHMAFVMSLCANTPDPTDGDAVTVRLLLTQDTAGLRRLLADHGTCTRGVLRKCFGDALDDVELEDVLTRAAYYAWRAADTFDPAKGTLRAWFFVIARNAGHELLREQQRPGWMTPGVELDRVAATAATPATTTPFLDTLRRCIAALPWLQRRIIEADLRSGDLADADELARKLRTTKNSIYVSRSNARKALKRALIEKGYQPGEGRSQELWN